jgi:hypothetical protein
MYSTCLHCTRDLGRNDILETLPIGRRVAFDAAQGRLWVVCRSCAKWNLVPFDTRLETIDACEQIFRDTRTRFSTDHIGLARARDGMDLVRIGAPQRPEFASWRYGEAYRRRRRREMATTGLAFTAPMVLSQFTHLVSVGSMAAGVGCALVAQGTPAAVQFIVAHRRRLRVVTPAGIPLALYDANLQSAALGWKDSEITLGLHSMLNWRKAGDPHEWTGPDARILARRVLARLNRTAGSKKEITDAVDLIGGQSGKLDAWLYWISHATWREKGKHWGLGGGGAKEYWAKHDRDALPLSTLAPSDRLAVEMWLSEEDEAKALAGELALLERQWKEAEKVAKIADGLTLSSP